MSSVVFLRGLKRPAARNLCNRLRLAKSAKEVSRSSTSGSVGTFVVRKNNCSINSARTIREQAPVQLRI